MDSSMKDLLMQLARVNTQDDRLDLLEKALIDDSPTADDTRISLTLGAAENFGKKKGNTKAESLFNQIQALVSRYDLDSLMAVRIADRMLDGLLPHEEKWSCPILRLPCANINPNIHQKCPETGVHACSSCLLVSYCSKECQKAHWGVHKRDCKHILNSKDWMPIWMRENRAPIFKKPLQSDSDKHRSEGHNPVGCGLSLWGNVPAINILNLENNEGLLYKPDLSLAFAASGDLRNVIMTINSIPTAYTGRIFVAINDFGPQVSARNLLLLLAISGVKNQDLAVDIALHLWYFALIPKEYNDRIAAFSRAALSTISNGRVDWKGENRLRIICDTTPLVSEVIKTYLDPSTPLNADSASQEYLRVMYSPDRVDYHDRYYCKLKPAHRLGMRQFRNHGLVLPFGAADPQFNTPNVTLFTKSGEWLQDDTNTPLGGWNLINVIASGKAHGAREEDIFGCLYFHLSEKLAEFKAKLSNLDITFYLSSMDCRELAANIKASSDSSTESIPHNSYPPGLPTRFDRVDVSNTVDDLYVGYDRILADWGPLLNVSNAHSTLLTYSMNWPWQCKGGLVTDNEVTSNRIMQKFIKQKASPSSQVMKRLTKAQIGKAPPSGVPFSLWTTISEIKCDAAIAAMYDNSKAFEDYLRKRRVSKSAADLRLQMQSKNTITPPRHGVAIDAPTSALPHFPEDNVWYTEVYLSWYSFYTRFQEFRGSTK